MKWFQHSVDSHDDPDISDAWDLLGDAGPNMFWVTLELYGREYNHTDPEGWLEISWAFFRRKLRKSSGKVQEFLNFFREKNRIFSEIDGDRLRLMIPKFIEKADTWTKTQARKDTPELQRNFKETSRSFLEEEVQEEVKEEKSTPPSPPGGRCPHQEIIKIYHDVLPQLPRIQVWNDANKKTLGARWKEDSTRQAPDWWTGYFKTISQSDFLMGRSKTDWQCPGLSWLIGPKNMSKVLNGHYRNKVKPGESPEELARQERVDRLMIGDEEYDKIQKAKDGL